MLYLELSVREYFRGQSSCENKSEEAVWEVGKSRMVRKMQKEMSELKECAAEKIRKSGRLCRQVC